jgi:hypothetical protein
MDFAVFDGVRASESGRFRFLRTLDAMLFRLETFVTKYYWAAGATMIGATFFYLLFKDFRLHLWFDEIITLYMAKLNSVSQIADATRDGADGMPPLYNIICHLLLPIVPEPLAIRLPSTIGFCAMSVGILAYLHRRIPALYAFVAVLLAYQLALDYGTEGRAYGLICGLAALSLVCWQKIAEDQNRALWLGALALFSGAIVALHYFAVFFSGCLLLAEFVRWRRSRKFNYAVWLAVLAPVGLVLVLHYPLIVAARRVGEHFWSVAHLGQLHHFYTAPAALLIAAFVISAFLPVGESRRAVRAPMPPAELAAVVAIAFAPIVLVGVFKVLGQAFVLRYALWSVVGISELTAILLSFLGNGRPLVAVVSLAALAACMGITEARTLARIPDLRYAQPDRVALSKIPPGDEPVVVADPPAFTELWYYSPPDLRRRLVYPDCPNLDLKYLGYDSTTIVLESLARISPLKVESCAAFLSLRKPFKLVVDNIDYLVWVLASRGRTVVPEDIGKRIIFDVGAAG